MPGGPRLGTLPRMDLRELPSVDALRDAVGPSFPRLPAPIVAAACREAIDEARRDVLAGNNADPHRSATERLADIEATRPRSVINATGVLLHTNLGRAPMLHTAIARYAAQGRTAGNVEMDIRTGRRSSRHSYLSAVLRATVDAEDGFAVNNNAGALLLALASVAGDGARVAVSRGELIEIGGSFRLPELMSASGASLVEVGTTNRTRLEDFAQVAPTVAAILKVHPSNYRIEGFREEADAADLALLASHHGIPFIHDVGSGLIDENAPWLGDAPRDWLAHEPGVRQSVALGSDLVLFSGDKLLGGPQAGILVGRRDAVDRARRHPIARAVRLDGGTIDALAATLERYLSQQVLSVPFWRMVAVPAEEIRARAVAVTEGLTKTTIVDGESIPGAGSVPGGTIPTSLIRIDGDEDATWAALASDEEFPIVGVRRSGAVHLDLRSVLPEDDDHVRDTLRRLIG